MSDKAFTDLKAKQEAAAEQAQKKGSKSVALFGVEHRDYFDSVRDTSINFVNLCLNSAANQRSKKRKAEEDEESTNSPRLTSKQVCSVCSL